MACVTDSDERRSDFSDNAYYCTYSFVQQTVYNMPNTTSDQEEVREANDSSSISTLYHSTLVCFNTDGYMIDLEGQRTEQLTFSGK